MRKGYCNEILPKYVHLNVLKLNGDLEEFSITLRFLASKINTSVVIPVTRGYL